MLAFVQPFTANRTDADSLFSAVRSPLVGRSRGRDLFPSPLPLDAHLPFPKVGPIFARLQALACLQILAIMVLVWLYEVCGEILRRGLATTAQRRALMHTSYTVASAVGAWASAAAPPPGNSRPLLSLQAAEDARSSQCSITPRLIIFRRPGHAILRPGCWKLRRLRLCLRCCSFLGVAPTYGTTHSAALDLPTARGPLRADGG